MNKIIKNRAKCRKCGAIFVDGGLDYLRAGGELKYFKELYEFENIKEIKSS